MLQGHEREGASKQLMKLWLDFPETSKQRERIHTFATISGIHLSREADPEWKRGFIFISFRSNGLVVAIQHLSSKQPAAMKPIHPQQPGYVNSTFVIYAIKTPFLRKTVEH